MERQEHRWLRNLGLILWVNKMELETVSRRVEDETQTLEGDRHTTEMGWEKKRDLHFIKSYLVLL